MKRVFTRTLLPIAVAVMSSSCSKNDITNDIVTGSDGDNVAITVKAATTKGEDLTTYALEDSEDGVVLHVDDSGSISGYYEFEFDTDDWSQSTTPALVWGSIEFPVYFYSLHDGSPMRSVTYGVGSASMDYVVTDASSEHNDLVYHASELSAIPTGGTINLYHKHALSKISIYAGTGTNIAYIARVNLVDVDGEGKVTITPVDADDISLAGGVSWLNGSSNSETYEYYSIGDDAQPALQTTQVDNVDVNPIVSPHANAPLMIIPQKLAGVTSDEIKSAAIEGSYLEVIYYLTDAKGAALVGYSSVRARTDASNYIALDQDKTLYVIAAFPISYTFSANQHYNITLGLGMSGSTGGLLLEDNYVDKDGNTITLTAVGSTTSTTPEIPEIDEGDNILAGTDDEIDIIVTATDWGDATSFDAN